MILSHKHRFVFIKGLKVAGTSTEIALSQICGPDDIITPITAVDERYRLGTAGEPRNFASDPAIERAFRRQIAKSEPGQAVRVPQDRFYNHMSLTDVVGLVPEAATYELLFVERSPYAKVISLANWEANRAAYDRGGSLAQNAEGLSESLDEIISDGRICKVRNIDRYRRPDGTIPTPGWRLDTLAQCLDHFVRERSEQAIPLVHSKGGFGSESIDFRATLTPAHISHINEIFAEEFATFGFVQVDAE